jgi:hypothetical protein
MMSQYNNAIFSSAPFASPAKPASLSQDLLRSIEESHIGDIARNAGLINARGEFVDFPNHQYDVSHETSTKSNLNNNETGKKRKMALALHIKQSRFFLHPHNFRLHSIAIVAINVDSISQNDRNSL